MGKITGFMEYPRVVAPDRPPRERISDWQEFIQPLDEKGIETQAARCMDCGIPYCQSGTLLNGMTAGCPTHNLIPEWNDLVYRGAWQEALTRLLKTTNFPEFTGRVCPAPCEGSCTVGRLGAPAVAIKSIERQIIDRGFAEGWVVAEPPSVRTGKKVAVVGSGPSGLAAAAQLNKAGHWVTVFERADHPGGLLMYGIPNMKLDKGIVDRRLDLMREEGIHFVTNTEVGNDYPVEQLRADFDAVVLCIGATNPRDLPVPGRQSRGVHFAMDFLRNNTKRLSNPNHPYISAEGKDVIVIGGGDTGTDCVGTAIRQHCRRVIQLEIMEENPPTRGAENPWPEFPRIYKMDYGQEEARVIFGDDPREYKTTAKRFTANERGEVTGLDIVRLRWEKGDGGRMRPVEVDGSEQHLEGQLILLAMGYLGPEAMLLDKMGIERDSRQNAKAEYGTFTTNLTGVFAAGDARRGQSLVVWAINEGRAAARECDRYLMTETDLS